MRTVCWFSCGAASAVATKIAIKEATGEIVIAYTEGLGKRLRFLGMIFTTGQSIGYLKKTISVLPRAHLAQEH